MNYFFLMLLSMPVFAQTTSKCPTESFAVEFMSPITKAKKSFCAYQKDEATIKHGEEIIFNSKYEVKTRIF